MAAKANQKVTCKVEDTFVVFQHWDDTIHTSLLIWSSQPLRWDAPVQSTRQITERLNQVNCIILLELHRQQRSSTVCLCWISVLVLLM